MERLAIALLVLAAAPAAAHEVVTTVERGRAVAVRAQYADGAPLANAVVEVWSPADAEAPHLDGLTDRNGWVAFVPDAPGAWRVKIVEADGHGVDAVVDVPAAGAPAGSPGAAPPSPLAFALRPVLGVALVALLFGVLFAFGRRRAKAGPR